MSLPILGFIAGFLGLGGAGLLGFEKSAARDLRATLQGENATVSVRTSVDLGVLNGDILKITIDAARFSTTGLPLFTEPDRPKDGAVRKLHLSLRDFTLRGMRIDRLEAAIPDCRFDLGLAMRKRQIRLSQSGTGLGTVRIRDTDLEAFVVSKYHEFKKVSVQIKEGRIHVSGQGVFLIFDTQFSMDALITPLDGSKLILSDAHIFFDGKPTDDLSQKALLNTLNPVVDLNRDLNLHGAINLTSVTLGEGYLETTGAVTIPDK